MAVATPTGTMKTVHTAISQIVPQIADFAPALLASMELKLVMKSQLR